MKVRDWMNNNSALVTIAAVVLLVISLGVIIMQTKGPGQIGPVELYFYDLNTGELFVAMSDQNPPITAPSGPYGDENGPPAGVRAHVYACGECGDLEGKTVEEIEATGAYISHLEMYTPEGKAALEAQKTDPNTPMMVDPMEYTRIKSVEGDRWLLAYSEEANALAEQSIRECPDGEPVEVCRP